VEALLAEWRRCPPVRVTFAAFVEYKAPAAPGTAREQREQALDEHVLVSMFGGVRGVTMKRAGDDPVIRAAFPERFAEKTGTDG
jgi:hypothetical protein